VEAITLADIPTELDKQIRQLKVAADEHNVKQDEQLQTITTLRTQLGERITSLRSVLDEVQGSDPVAKDRHDEQLDASRTTHTRVDQLSEVLESRADQLKSAMKEQKQLILALKSFLEDKTSRLETSLKSGHERVKESEYHSSWPSSTLSAAYFAALLLSSVLSSVATTSIVTRKQHSLTGHPVFIPADYSLPGLGTLNKIQIQPSLKKRIEKLSIKESTTDTVVATQDKQVSSTRGTVTSTQTKAKDSKSMKLSDDWVQDYSRTQMAVRQRDEPMSKPGRLGQVGNFPAFPGGRGPMSMLQDPDGDAPGDNAPGDGDPNTGTGGFRESPGPVIPSTDNGGSNWANPGGESGTAPSSSGGYGGGGNDSSDDSDSS
jgi:hypothetical protein